MTTTIPTSNSPNLEPGPLDTPRRDAHFQLPEIGQRIGSNRIIDLIAEGGMATVYKVWHEDLEIVRAIKILKPGFDEESKNRLRTEAKISAHLRHPNIVEIYGVQFWNETVPYLEMEFVDGYSLKAILDKQRTLPPVTALAIVYYVCNALHYAHNQVFTLYGKTYEGIVHRDIKPANILITQNGVPKLADFGIAKPQDISLHTEGQKVLGTFTYLSPEQLEGESIDKRSDIYSLGAVLYECLTGLKAFPQKSLTDLVREKLRNNYPSFESLKLDLPKKTEQVINKSMDLTRDRRYATAEEFGTELFDVLRKTTSETPDQVLAAFCAGRVTQPKRPRKASRGLQPVILFSALIFGIALVALGVISGAVKLKQSHQSTTGAPALPPVQTREPAVAGHNRADSDTAATMAAHNADTGIPHAPSNAPTAVRKQGPPQDSSAKASYTANPLDAAVAAMRNMRWREAVTLLEKVKTETLSDSVRQGARLMLLESYLGLHDITNATIIVERTTQSDGYFFLLAGETYLKSGKVSRAIDYFCKAQTTPSRYRKDLRMDATFLWAKALVEAYKEKPNSENKRACERAWQQFTAAFCADPDHTGHCREAEAALRELEE